MYNEVEIVYPETPADWREWLEKHHDSRQSVWVVFYNKNTGKKSITWSESVDQALCFGWIDSTKKRLDEERSIQFFSRRKPNSTWSRINKLKVEALIAEGLMTEAGYTSIERAKQNGSWTILDEVEALVVPNDLAKALREHSGAEDYFSGLSKSAKKMLLHWIVMAKRPETRKKRIDELVVNAAQQQKPQSFR